MSAVPEVFRGPLGRRFEFVRHIGQGGMAEVYLCMDRFHQREVALKIVRSNSPAMDEERTKVEALWVNEMRLAGRLKHPYILEVYEAGTEGEITFLVMEYLSGGTLKNHAEPHNLLPIPRVADIIFKVCHALEYANTEGLLHRDIKPANVLLAGDGTPKVSDFGAVYLTGTDETQVVGVGTLPFMPPEHFEGARPDVQNDIYAVGVMAYNLLTGSWPNQGTDQAAMIYDKLHNDPVPLESRRPEVPAGLRAAIYRAMHRDRRVRYQSWKVFREVLSATFPEIRDDSTAAYESERFETLRTVPFFARFTETELWEAVRIGVRRYYEPKAEVIEEGSSDTTVYVVQAGELEVIHRGVRVGRIQAGEGFGEMSYIEGTERPRSASVRTQIPTYLIAFPANALKSASHGLQAAFARAIVSLLVRRLIGSNDRYVAAVKTAKTSPEKQ
jgi:tRNA A-37 threonylcarbamoyl transferase component Bud32